jgi:hypothetical protein
MLSFHDFDSRRAGMATGTMHGTRDRTVRQADDRTKK